MIDGETYTFATRGLYNGMSLMGDHQTGSYWDHVTGECLYGPLKGRRLALEPLRHMRADQALAQYPDARIARSRMPLPFGLTAGLMKILVRLTKGRFLPPGFAGSMGEEDPRRPRLEMGLGVWTERVSRYYPLAAFKERGGVLPDEIDGRQILVYLDPVSGTPTPLFVDAQHGEWEGGDLRLDSGVFIRQGRLYDPSGTELPIGHPLHLFVRWYGFSLTFPGCEIYGEAEETGR